MNKVLVAEALTLSAGQQLKRVRTKYYILRGIFAKYKSAGKISYNDSIHVISWSPYATSQEPKILYEQSQHLLS